MTLIESNLCRNANASRNKKHTLSSPVWLSYALMISSYKGDRNLSGFGTEVIVFVAPVISFLMVLSALSL